MYATSALPCTWPIAQRTHRSVGCGSGNRRARAHQRNDRHRQCPCGACERTGAVGWPAASAFGQGCDPGPVYQDFPTDTLRADVPRVQQLDEHFRPKPRPLLIPAANEVAAAVDLLWSAKRPLVISGRGARGAGAELCAILDSLGAPNLTKHHRLLNNAIAVVHRIGFGEISCKINRDN